MIEELDYEKILTRMKEELIKLYPANLLESDPAMKILEVVAWRELLLRQRINDATKANLLAFATKADLDHLAAFYDVTRKENEDDEAFRRRIRVKIRSWSTAGSRDHYRYHALSADTRIKDARAESPSPGLVRISILSHEGIASEELLDKVRAIILRDDIKVLTDTVEVVSSKIIPVSIEAKIYTETTENIIEATKSTFIKTLNQKKALGWNLTVSWIIAKLFTEGIQSIELINPTEDIIVQDHECILLDSIKLDIGGSNW